MKHLKSRVNSKSSNNISAHHRNNESIDDIFSLKSFNDDDTIIEISTTKQTNNKQSRNNSLSNISNSIGLNVTKTYNNRKRSVSNLSFVSEHDLLNDYEFDSNNKSNNNSNKLSVTPRFRGISHSKTNSNISNVSNSISSTLTDSDYVNNDIITYNWNKQDNDDNSSHSSEMSRISVDNVTVLNDKEHNELKNENETKDDNQHNSPTKNGEIFPHTGNMSLSGSITKTLTFKSLNAFDNNNYISMGNGCRILGKECDILCFGLFTQSMHDFKTFYLDDNIRDLIYYATKYNNFERLCQDFDVKNKHSCHIYLPKKYTLHKIKLSNDQTYNYLYFLVNGDPNNFNDEHEYFDLIHTINYVITKISAKLTQKNIDYMNKNLNNNITKISDILTKKFNPDLDDYKSDLMFLNEFISKLLLYNQKTNKIKNINELRKILGLLFNSDFIEKFISIVHINTDTQSITLEYVISELIDAYKDNKKLKDNTDMHTFWNELKNSRRKSIENGYNNSSDNSDINDEVFLKEFHGETSIMHQLIDVLDTELIEITLELQKPKIDGNDETIKLL